MFCVAFSLAQLTSAFPNAGDQYYWAARLTPKSWHRSASYVIGKISWASTICGCASVSNVCPEGPRCANSSLELFHHILNHYRCDVCRELLVTTAYRYPNTLPGCTSPVQRPLLGPCLFVPFRRFTCISDLTWHSTPSSAVPYFLQYVSYSFCILCLLKHGRSSITHGPFCMGNFGLFCNIVTVV